MSTVFGVDLDQRRAERTYRELVPADDDFHDEELTDRWWETETCWFSWNVPERNLGGWTYCQARPNANICNGGAWVWDDTRRLPVGAGLPGRVLGAAAAAPGRTGHAGLRVAQRGACPGHRAADHATPSATATPARSRWTSTFEAIMAPNPHPDGVVPFLKGAHFDQAGHVTGTMVLHGEEIPIDCYSVRDRSWGPRPQGRPKPEGAGAGEQKRPRRSAGRSAASATPSAPPDRVRPG